MLCWNCGCKLAPNAAVCAHCEAPVMPEPTPEEMEAAREILDHMPSDLMAEIHETFLESATAEEFVNRIMVGNCPKCDSTDTGDCEDDPEINELLVGRCYACGQLWCTECLRLLDRDAPVCPCWDEEE